MSESTQLCLFEMEDLTPLPPSAKSLLEAKVPKRMIIPSIMFEPGTWERTLKQPTGPHQYSRFCATVMAYFRAGTSKDDEVKSFIDLLHTDSNPDFLRIPARLIPELRQDGPNPANEHVTQVVNGLQQLIRQRIEAAKSSDMGDREKVAKLLFGPNGERNATPAMTRLLTSYMEMESESLTTTLGGFRQDKSTQHDVDGLPNYPRLRPYRQQSPEETSPVDTPVAQAQADGQTDSPEDGQADDRADAEWTSASGSDEEYCDDPPSDLLVELVSSDEDSPEKTETLIRHKARTEEPSANLSTSSQQAQCEEGHGSEEGVMLAAEMPTRRESEAANAVLAEASDTPSVYLSPSSPRAQGSASVELSSSSQETISEQFHDAVSVQLSTSTAIDIPLRGRPGSATVGQGQSSNEPPLPDSPITVLHITPSGAVRHDGR